MIKINQKDYSEIAGIINKELDIFSRSHFKEERETSKYIIKVISLNLADYFEREVERINRVREDNYLLEHKGVLSEKAKEFFNRQQFIKDCGVK